MRSIAAALRAVAWLAFLLATALPAAAQAIVRVTPESVGEGGAAAERLAVIFVHGLGGSRETWLNGETYWPTLLATQPELAGKIDIYRVDYDSYLFTASPRMSDVHSGVVAKLDPIVVDGNDKRVVFIAHSLGGIVTFRYLEHIKLQWGHAKLARVRLVLAFGVPLRGGSGAGFASYLIPARRSFDLGFSGCAPVRVPSGARPPHQPRARDTAAVDGLGPSELWGGGISRNPQLNVLVAKNDFSEALSSNFEALLAKRDRAGCPALSVHAAFEKKPLHGAIIVERPSATAFANHRGDRRAGFDVDHSGLVKPAGRDDPVHAWTVAAIGECLAATGRVCTGEIGPGCR